MSHAPRAINQGQRGVASNLSLRTSSLSLAARASACADALLFLALALGVILLCPPNPPGRIGASASTRSSPLESTPDINRADDTADDDTVEFGEYPPPGNSELEGVDKRGEGQYIPWSPSPSSSPSSSATDNPRDLFQSGTYSSLRVDGSCKIVKRSRARVFCYRRSMGVRFSGKLSTDHLHVLRYHTDPTPSQQRAVGLASSRKRDVRDAARM